MAGLRCLALSIEQVEDAATKDFPLVKWESGIGKGSRIFRSAIRRMSSYGTGEGDEQGQCQALKARAKPQASMRIAPQLLAKPVALDLAGRRARLVVARTIAGADRRHAYLQPTGLARFSEEGPGLVNNAQFHARHR